MWSNIHLVHLSVCVSAKCIVEKQLSGKGVQTADADIRGPRSAAFLADTDGPQTRQRNNFADADHPRIWNHDQPSTSYISFQLS